MGPRAVRVISIWKRYGPLRRNGSEFPELMAQNFWNPHQETYDLRIHNRDFAQVNNCPFRAVAYFLLHQLQITRANSADQPDDFALPVGLPFNFQEMSTPP